MFLFQDCFSLLSSSLTKWDCVSATNENITFKPGSDQAGKQERALYSATHPACRYHLTGALRKLEKSSPVVWKEPPKAKKHLKPLLLQPSCTMEWGLSIHETFLQMQLILLFLSSIRQQSNTSSFLLCRNLHETRQCPLAFVGSQARWPHPPPKVQSCWFSSQKRAQGLQASQRNFILCTYVWSRMIWEPEYTCPLRRSAVIPNIKLKPEKAHKSSVQLDLSSVT